MGYTSPEVEEKFMEDIIDRLRVLNFMGPWQEAADEIERLRGALKELEWQLKNQLYDVAYETVIYTLWPKLKEKER